MSESSESLYNDVVSEIPQLTNLEMDQQLETAAVESEKAEMLVCCYLSAVGERRAYRDFGYTSITDYAHARFGFGARKTGYLVSLGRKIEHLPKIRAALASGKLGWCKASRLASVAAPDNEVMWLESALSLTVQQLEHRINIKGRHGQLASVLHLPLTEDRRILWENALEIYRRRAGAEISPVEAFELMLAEVIAEWGYVPADTETPDKPDEPETEATMPADEDDAPETTPPGDNATEAGPVFPWVEARYWLNWPNRATEPVRKRACSGGGAREAPRLQRSAPARPGKGRLEMSLSWLWRPCAITRSSHSVPQPWRLPLALEPHRRLQFSP